MNVKNIATIALLTAGLIATTVTFADNCPAYSAIHLNNSNPQDPYFYATDPMGFYYKGTTLPGAAPANFQYQLIGVTTGGGLNTTCAYLSFSSQGVLPFELHPVNHSITFTPGAGNWNQLNGHSCNPNGYDVTSCEYNITH